MESTTVAAAADISDTVDQVSHVAELIYKYGFIIVFCAVILVIAIIVVIALVINSNRKHQATLKAEQDKAAQSLSLDRAERESHIKTNEKMVSIVTEVQTEQISQLHEMSNILTSLKNELKISTAAIQDIGTSVTLINQSLSNLEKQNEHNKKDIGEMTKMIHELHTLVCQLNTKIDTTIQIMKDDGDDKNDST